MTLDKYSELWEFVSRYLPNFYTRDDVTESDILVKYITGDEVSEEDTPNMSFDEIFERSKELEKELVSEAIDAFYNEHKDDFRKKVNRRENVELSLNPAEISLLKNICSDPTSEACKFCSKSGSENGCTGECIADSILMKIKKISKPQFISFVLDQANSNKIITLESKINKLGVLNLVKILQSGSTDTGLFQPFEVYAFIVSESALNELIKDIDVEIYGHQFDRIHPGMMLGRDVYAFPDNKFPCKKCIIAVANPEYLGSDGIGMCCLKDKQ